MLHNFYRKLELSDRLETNYIRILYYDFSEKYSDDYKSYEYARLCTILEGEKTVAIGEHTFHYNSRQFMLMPPGSDVHMTIGRPTKAMVFELNDDLIRQVCEKVSTEYHIDYDLLIKDRLLCAPENSDLQDVLARIHRLLAENNQNAEYVLDLYAQELVYQMLQIKGVRQLLTLQPDNPVNKAIRFMKEQYRSPISIRQIAEGLGMSEANFSQYFKKVTGISPKEYLTNIKMEKARDIIQHSSVTDAAFDLGYENISHFITLFKERYGITPKQFQMTTDNR